MSDVDYCELCDLPKSTCIHGNPPAPPLPTTRAATPRATPVRRRTTSSASRSPAAPPRVVSHRWTPPDTFRVVILEVLAEHGGEMDQDDAFDALEAAMGERLKPADHEKTPEGELRWRYAARRARQALIAEGSMTKGRPGIWALA
ncbi:hypothetical protein [Nocardioides sp. YIM 152315]|uniref:hypothetical protein n=1 Tax=Nocardioides sp. YIM 152315 TaxID=3031760 RepID=UPI0023DB396C|nr:hypothetical protein [Nocardioides sp. YIM 152315]MDF1605657.1 hypothetical protein [Nocardioides sp. YIM 152315]